MSREVDLKPAPEPVSNEAKVSLPATHRDGVPTAPAHRSTPALAGRNHEGSSDLSRFEICRQRIADQLVERLDLSALGDCEPDQLRRDLRQVVEHLVDQADLTLARDLRDRLVDAVLDEAFGFGPLDELLRDPQIVEIHVHGTAGLWSRRLTDDSLQLVSQPESGFRDREHLLRILERLTGRPLVGADQPVLLMERQLSTGWNVHAVAGTSLPDGPIVRLSAPLPQDVTFPLEQEAERHLREMVSQKQRILICGPAGSGKTRLMSQLAAWIPADSRTVTIETSLRLRIAGTHVIRLVAGAGNEPESTAAQLISSGRELRPEWLFADDPRPGAVAGLLQTALCDGSGVVAAVRSRDAVGALLQLELARCELGTTITSAQARRELAGAFDSLVQLANDSGKIHIQGIFRAASQGDSWQLTPLSPKVG